MASDFASVASVELQSFALSLKHGWFCKFSKLIVIIEWCAVMILLVDVAGCLEI